MHEVALDPLFHEKLRAFELSCRRFRQAVADLRYFHYHHTGSPAELSTTEKWRSALLQEAVCTAQTDLESAVSDMTHYGFGLSSVSGVVGHLSSIEFERQSQQKRIEGSGAFSRTLVGNAGKEEILLQGPDGEVFTVILRESE